MQTHTCKYKRDAKESTSSMQNILCTNTMQTIKMEVRSRCKVCVEPDAELCLPTNTRQIIQVCTNSTQPQGRTRCKYMALFHLDAMNTSRKYHWESAAFMISIAQSCRWLRIRHSRHLLGLPGATPHWCLHNLPRRHTGRPCWNCYPDSSSPLSAQ